MGGGDGIWGDFCSSVSMGSMVALIWNNLFSVAEEEEEERVKTESVEKGFWEPKSCVFRV